MWSYKKEGKEMKKLLLLLVLFMNTACANNLEIRMVKKHQGIHSEFKPYVQEFIMISKGKVDENDFHNFSMGFRDYSKDSSTVGTCHYGAFEVDISKKWWNQTTSPSERLELVFHEFGHCILKRGHTKKPEGDGWLEWFERMGFKLGFFTEKGYLSDGCPASFMHPYTLGEMCINRHFNYYMNELFGRFERNNYVESRAMYREPSEKKTCKKPIIVNKTNSWNDRDQQTLIRAKRTCIVRYKSCLEKFWKKTQLSYAAWCGK